MLNINNSFYACGLQTQAQMQLNAAEIQLTDASENLIEAETSVSIARNRLLTAEYSRGRYLDSHVVTVKKNRHRIDSLNAEIEVTYQDMKLANDSASKAYGDRNSAALSTFMQQTKIYKQEIYSCTKELDGLLHENSLALELYETSLSTYKAKSLEFSRANLKLEASKRDFKLAFEDFKHAERELKNLQSALGGSA